MGTTAVKTVFAPITKFEKDPETGFVTTYGKMTGPDLDFDGQICDPAWLAKEVPEWFTTGANVREMHTPKAVGVGQELIQDGDDWWLKALVVDPVACVKVENRVLTGYSIGISGLKTIKDLAAPNGRIVGGKIVENSLADRPSNPTCKFVVAKAIGAGRPGLEYAGEWATKLDETTDPEVDSDTAGSGTDPAPVEEQVEAGIVDEIRARLAAWLASEAVEVADGGSVYVVRMIASLLTDLDWAKAEDEYDDIAQAVAAVKTTLTNRIIEEDPMDIETITKTVAAATGKTATAAQKTQLAELRKALGGDLVDELVARVDEIATTVDALPDTVAAEATKVTAPAVERIEALEGTVAEVRKVQATFADTVQSTGPQRIGGTTSILPDATKALEASRLRQLSKVVVDPDLAAGYRQMAYELEASISR